MQYLEKAIEVLSGLKNANILGWIMAYNDVIMQELAKISGAVPHYLEIVRKFEGEVTKSTVDTTINLLFSPLHPSHSPSIRKPPLLQPREHKMSSSQRRSMLNCRLQMMVYHRDHLPRDLRHVDWCCHRCRLLGHMHRDCPTRRIPCK